MAKPAAKKPRRSRGGVPSDLRDRTLAYKADLHLFAYKLDPHPAYLVDALLAYLNDGAPVPVDMLPVVRELRRILGRKRTREGLRNVLIARRILVEFKGEIPAQIPTETVADLARAHGMTHAAVRVAIHRLRKRLA